MPPSNSCSTSLNGLTAGLQRYRQHCAAHPPRRPDAPVLLHLDTTRLLDYGHGHGRPLLVVPSLINRASILDISDTHSFLRALAGQGWRPLLTDWGVPGEQERHFTLEAYITQRLEPLLSAVCLLARQPVPVIGHCMGGLLALALALRRPRDVQALALLMTPWDFHQAATQQQRDGLQWMRPALEVLCQRHPALSPDVLQYLFVSSQPWSVMERLQTLGRMPRPQEATMLLLLEQWLNDGVPLASAVARETLFDWYLDNTPHRGQWQVGGMAVSPRNLSRPVWLASAARDTLVPPASSAPLAAAIDGAVCHMGQAGHIGMIAGRSARAQLWQPLADWLQGLG